MIDSDIDHKNKVDDSGLDDDDDDLQRIILSNSEGGKDSDNSDSEDMIDRRSSQLYVDNTISSSKNKTGNMFSKTAWETLNKSGTRWAIRTFIRFGRSSYISKSILNNLGTYLFDSVWWFDTDLPLIALTIDDVPGLDPETNEKILTLLNDYEIKCTFFVTERNARYIKNADHFLRRCINEGHELGNHLAKDIPAHKLPISTFTKHLLECEQLISKYNPEHISSNVEIVPPTSTNGKKSNSSIQSTTQLSNSSISQCQEVNNTELVENDIKKETKTYKWFRPPFGRLTKQQYELVISRGYTVAMCDVYPNDVNFQGFPQFLAQFCTNNAAPGSIVCVHIPSNSFRSANIEVFRLMLPEISRKYRCVTLSELARRVYQEYSSNI